MGTSKVWIRITCLDLATSWCTRKTPRWDRPKSSTHRSRCSTFRTKSRWATRRSVSCDVAECSFQPQQPLVCDTFKNCEGLSRVAFMDGNGVVMLGKVISCEKKDEADKGGKKK